MTEKDTQPRKALYAAVWRWHFYMGLYVAPFLVMLSLTGLVILFKEPGIDGYETRRRLKADPETKGAADARPLLLTAAGLSWTSPDHL